MLLRCSVEAGTHAMLLKQLESLKCPTWQAATAESAAAPAPGSAAQPLGPLRVFLATSDGGPDQMKCRRLMKYEAAPDPRLFFIDVSCVMHGNHLIYKDGLVRIDSWLAKCKAKFRYFSSLAKITHVWRDLARLVFENWTSNYSAQDAMLHARTLVPKCIAGRWGSISATELRLLSATEPKVLGTLGQILQGNFETQPAELAVEDAGGAGAGPSAPQQAQQLCLDENTIQEQEQYRLKMGRWRRDVAAVVKEPLFWTVMRIARVCHMPLDHMLAFSSTAIEPDALAESGGHVAQLVCGKARAILDEFEQILFETDWGAACPDVLSVPRHEVFALAVDLNMNHLAGFRRRIVAPCERRAA